MDLMTDTFFQFFSYNFVIYAFIVGILVALCASLMGVTLVLKRFSYIGDGLSHIAFGAISIATVLKVTNQNFLVFPITAICAILLLRIGQNAKINGDAAIAMMSVGSLAVGYLIMYIFPTSTNLAGDVCTTLFGATSILTLAPVDVYICAGLSVMVIGMFLLFYNKIFSVTFDETFARATGVKAGVYNFVFAVIIAAVIVVAMNLVGSLLITALVVFPALTSMRIFGSFKAVIISSATVGVLCAAIGLVISILGGTPVGSTIVVVNICLFAVASLLQKVRRLA